MERNATWARRRSGKTSVFFAIGLAMAMFLGTAGTASAKHADCEEFWKAVNLPGVSVQPPWVGNLIHVQVCRPKNKPWPTVGQLLIHGSGNDMREFDSDAQPEKYSYIEMTAKAGGFVTVQIDRLGVGLSTHPLAEQVTVDRTISVIAQIAQGMRDGTLDSGAIYKDDCPGASHFNMPALSKIVYHGKSLATGYGWRLARDYPDAADAFILEGSGHDTPLQWIQDVGAHFGFPAKDHPLISARLAAVDPAVVTGPGAANTLFYDPNAFNPFTGQPSGMGYITHEPLDPENPDPDAPYGWFAEVFIWEQGTSKPILREAESKSADVSSYLVVESAFAHAVAVPTNQPCSAPAANRSESCAVTKPVIFLLGQHDGAVCGQPSFGTLWQGPSGAPGPGMDCSGTPAQAKANFLAVEQPFYNVPLDVIVIPDAGHHGHVANSFKGTAFPALIQKLHAAGF